VFCIAEEEHNNLRSQFATSSLEPNSDRGYGMRSEKVVGFCGDLISYKSMIE
jgi:hypothetical protein